MTTPDPIEAAIQAAWDAYDAHCASRPQRAGFDEAIIVALAVWGLRHYQQRWVTGDQHRPETHPRRYPTTAPDHDAVRCPLCGGDTSYAASLTVHLSEHHDASELAAILADRIARGKER